MDLRDELGMATLLAAAGVAIADVDADFVHGTAVEAPRVGLIAVPYESACRDGQGRRATGLDSTLRVQPGHARLLLQVGKTHQHLYLARGGICGGVYTRDRPQEVAVGKAMNAKHDALPCPDLADAVGK